MIKEWKPARGRFASGEELWIGKICVGSWFNPSVRRGDPTIYRAATTLPGIQLKHGTTDFPTSEDAKARVERVVDVWFKWLEEKARD